MQRKTNYSMAFYKRIHEKDDLELIDKVVIYVSENINHDLDRYAYNRMGDMREPLYSACPELDERIAELVEEFLEDNDLDLSADDFDTEEIFMHDLYEYQG